MSDPAPSGPDNPYFLRPQNLLTTVSKQKNLATKLWIRVARNLLVTGIAICATAPPKRHDLGPPDGQLPSRLNLRQLAVQKRDLQPVAHLGCRLEPGSRADGMPYQYWKTPPGPSRRGCARLGRRVLLSRNQGHSV